LAPGHTLAALDQPTSEREATMINVGLYVRLEAKAGKEAELAKFLKGALPLAQEEPETVVWYALQFGPSTFGIFDAFAGESGRSAHLNGRIAAALMAKAADLLAETPKIERVDVLASKA
jgi:quinol monooxygenase YgiN